MIIFGATVVVVGILYVAIQFFTKWDIPHPIFGYDESYQAPPPRIGENAPLFGRNSYAAVGNPPGAPTDAPPDQIYPAQTYPPDHPAPVYPGQIYPDSSNRPTNANV